MPTRLFPFVLLAAVPFVAGSCHVRAPAAEGPSSAPAAPLAAPPLVLPDDGMVAIGGGESLHVHCAGAGSPPVVLEECLGCTATNYRPIEDGIARFTRVCAYDHAGAGYSSPAPKPHLARQLVGDLRELLGAHDASGPVVLVGHGLGGLLAQVYARDFPGAVAGMVLVDAQTKEHHARYYATFPPDGFVAMKKTLSEAPENIDIDDQLRTMDDLRRAPLSLGDRPLVVVSRGASQPPAWGIPADSWEKLETSFRAIQAELPSLSHNSTQIVAKDAQWILDDAPDRVVSATWQVVSSARTGVPLTQLPASAAAPASAPSPAATALKVVVPSSVPAASRDDGLVDVGKRSLHLHCLGHGAPTVIMEAGRDESGTAWDHVQPEIAKLTRTCVYDRAGLGFSDKPTAPRTVTQILDDLHALLGAAGVPAPYVLVGHSIGGLYVRLYAARHPDQVAGMVLVDGSTEDQDLKLWSLLPPEGLKMMDDPDDPEAIRFDALRVAMAELRSANRSIGDRPLVVLTAGLWEDPMPGVSPEQNARQGRIWQEMQAALAPRISPNSTQIVAKKSHHHIQQDNPKLVIASVHEVVEAARTRGRVGGETLKALAEEAE